MGRFLKIWWSLSCFHTHGINGWGTIYGTDISLLCYKRSCFQIAVLNLTSIIKCTWSGSDEYISDDDVSLVQFLCSKKDRVFQKLENESQTMGFILVKFVHVDHVRFRSVFHIGWLFVCATNGG